LQREVSEARHAADTTDDLSEHFGKVVEVLLTAGHVDSNLVPCPHVIRRTPPSAVGVINEFEPNHPRVEGVFGDDQAKTRDQHRFAVEASTVSFEIVAKVLDGDFVLACIAAHHMVGL
jgi:hypothetical protein